MKEGRRGKLKCQFIASTFFYSAGRRRDIFQSIFKVFNLKKAEKKCYKKNFVL